MCPGARKNMMKVSRSEEKSNRRRIFQGDDFKCGGGSELEANYTEG